MRPFKKKKITEGNARNSRLSNCVEVTKNQKNTRGSESYEQKTRASQNARVLIMHIATENMWFLRKVRKPLLKPFISTITVISRQLKKER